eukprot:INCI5665.2.p1 GENE.INCI5665.2~~INCI5665.2.p1  ORF type:complete len:633 (-),score=63.24 INCI5665.2:201-2099(-)
MDTKLVAADNNGRRGGAGGPGEGGGGGGGGKKSVTPPGIYVYYFLAIALGSDYTINLSSAPSYFSRISVFNATAGDTAHGLSNISGLECNVLDFYSNTTASGDANYSYSLTLWSLGQFLGCIASIFMPPKLGNRVSFLLFVALSAVGNLMYCFADPSFAGSTSLALTGKFINGFGDGSIALGMSYLPLYAPLDKKAEALVNYRTFVSIGTAVGCGISIAIATTFVGSDTCINPGNLCTFINTGFFVAIFFGGFAINTKKPPTKGLNSFDRSFAAIFWICLNFFRGFCTQIGNAYVPTYAYTTEMYSPFVASAFPSIVLCMCYVSSFVCSFLVTAAGCVRWNQFCCNRPCQLVRNKLGGQKGRWGEPDLNDRVEVETLDYRSLAGSDSDESETQEYQSVHSRTRSPPAPRPLSFYFKRRDIARSTLLNSVRTSAVLVVFAMLLMFFGSAHRSMVDTPLVNEKFGDQVLFIIGCVLFFGFTTMISAAAVPIFKNVLPRSALSTMMPLFKVSLDLGKVAGPLWATMATTINREDVAPYVSLEGWLVGYIPAMAIFIVIFIITIVLGRKISTPAQGASGSGAGPSSGPGGQMFSTKPTKDISLKVTNSRRVVLGHQRSVKSVTTGEDSDVFNRDDL